VAVASHSIHEASAWLQPALAHHELAPWAGETFSDSELWCWVKFLWGKLGNKLVGYWGAN